MTALSHAEALKQWGAIQKEVYSPTGKRLSDVQVEKLEELAFQLDPQDLSESIASLLRVMWCSLVHAGEESDASDIAATLWLAADLSEIAGEMAAAKGDAQLYLERHRELSRNTRRRKPKRGTDEDAG